MIRLGINLSLASVQVLFLLTVASRVVESVREPSTPTTP